MSFKRPQMVQILLLLLLVQSQTTSGFLSWFFGSKDTEKSESTDHENEVEVVGSSFMTELRAKKINFDVKTVDEKFISDMTVKEMKSLSPLDGCYHQVMTRLRKTCSNLNEEQVSKIAVQLLNCQLETEKRPSFSCDEDMTLAQCTKSMDPTVWNSYQIVSNRARAVCYAIRQQQFRWKSEMAVNQLMHSTVEQLNAMKDIKEGQETVAEATSSVLRKMYEGQQDLMVGHETLKDSHNDIHKYVADNLKELTKEKAMIATGNKELAELIDQIRTKMDDATHQLLEQQVDTQQNHEEVLKDLSEIRSKAREVWEKIDKSSKHVLHFHNETTEQYKRTLDNLEKVNNTINYVLSSVNSMQSGIDSKLKWLSELLGGTDDKIALLSIGAIHMVYFLLAALSASFLQTPWITRVIVMIIVPLNAFSEIRQGVSLDFSAMTLFILFSSAASWFSQRIGKASRQRLASIKGDGGPVPTTPYRCPHTSPSSPIFTPMVPPMAEKQGLTDSDLKKLARTLKGYLKSSRASSTCASTPLNLSRISTDSAIGTPNPFDDTTCTSYSKFETTLDTLPKVNNIGAETTESISINNDYTGATEDLSTTRMTDGYLTVDVLERTDITEIKPELEIVRRQLMQSLDPASRSRSINKSLPSSRTATPTRISRRATPVRGQGSRSNTPVRNQTPLRSQTPTRNTSSRPGTPSKLWCQSLTNAGQPCKIRCSGAEVYCHVHLVKNSDSRPVNNLTKDGSALDTSDLTKSFSGLAKNFSALEAMNDMDDTEINVTQ